MLITPGAIGRAFAWLGPAVGLLPLGCSSGAMGCWARWPRLSARVAAAAVRRHRAAGGGMEKLLSQLPDAFDLMSRTMRAGQTISQALQSVADEFSPPIAEEFGYCYDQQNLGLSPEAAMRDLARRTGLLELKIFVLAVMVHRQTGGNLSELLDKLASVIRDRYRIRGAIKRPDGRGTAAGDHPAGPAAADAGGHAVHQSSLCDRPVSVSAAVGGMFVSMAVGALWMHKIISFDF